MSDKEIERRRYDERARATLGRAGEMRGSGAIPPVLRRPYLAYEAAVRSVLRPRLRTLEIGAGTGAHTGVLTEAGADVVATDIATGALVALLRGMDDISRERITPCACDMEDLPFSDSSFDLVASAGSLSYGDPEAVNAEILRVLRDGGCFVCVDSLNHNPIYRLNRWLHHRRGHRSASTVHRIPGVGRIGSLTRYFASVDVQYFGGFTWAMPVIARVTGDIRAAAISDALDRLFRVRRSAFKFVLLARGRRTRTA
jgi:ubiquinone/menaquinone biosynthesis C-methylase UbiE